jgi:tRNA G18 (ribose-2'-O)-methylase SpoU
MPDCAKMERIDYIWHMRKLTSLEISSNRFDSEDLAGLARLPVHAILDNIRSLYNVGSMFRTSDGARLGKLWLTGHTPHPPRKEIEKTALGATLTVPWEYVRDPLESIDRIKTSGYRLVVLEQTDGSVPYDSVIPSDLPLALVVGNEITGVSPEYVAAADGAIEIPMMGMKHSLNAAVAYGIAIFHLAGVVRRNEDRNQTTS